MRVSIALSLSMLAAACLGPQKAAQGSKAELSRASDVEVARLLSSPELRKANDEIVAAADGEGGLPGALNLVGDLFNSRDADARWAALARIEARSRAVLPRIRSRAQVLDAQARAMGAKDGLSYLVGSDAKARLERVCREQVGRTAGDWQQALEIVQRRMGGRPTVADFAAELIAEGRDTGAFFSARRLPEPSRSALAQTGFAEIFATIPRDLQGLREHFPEASTVDLERFARSAKAFDALAVRLNCLTARLEVEVAAGGDVEKSWGPMYEETFGTIPPVGPTWILLSPAYLSTPFYAIGCVDSAEG